MSDEVLGQGLLLQAGLFAALGDVTRLSLVARLCRASRQSISQLAEGTGLTRQAVTKHLRVLETAGLAKRQRRGRETLFELDAGPITTMTEYLDLVSAQWGRKLGDLEAFLDGPGS
jgi:DNA-binding transcriptional ArsR family regulator